jgi:exopolysaccharide biosynthesis predicted pyruvyltransferase EpsI
MHDIDSVTGLAQLFSTHRDRDWYFLSPGGNWGDHLIYAGAESLARSLGLRWTNLDFRDLEHRLPPPGAAVYLHGGGGLNPWCSGRAFENLRRALTVADALVVQGPQSCDTESPMTRELFAATLAQSAAREVHIFAREATSARFLAQVLPNAFRLHLDEDTAFHLPAAELLVLCGLPEIPAGRYRLLVARDDDEAPPAPLPAGKEVVSLDPAYVAKSFAHWLRIHAFASRIITNRLHSAIVGSLLGKPVELLPGSYHKNRSVWEFSLERRGVAWSDGLDGCAPSPQIAAWLPQRVRNSWKFQRALLRLRGVPLE